MRFPSPKYAIFLLPVVLFTLFLLALPDPLFREPGSTVLLDRNGELLGAKIAADQQWRFPAEGNVPEKFARAIVCYEDRFFRYHPGINLYAVIRAIWLNIRHGRIVSGGSTLSMQVIRLSRKNRPRTIPEKIIESFLALRLEFGYSKNEILRLYASHAPFGGNVVGLEAAAWRYFGTGAGNLSWAEAATLAVLPNSPGLIYPGRNPEYLLRKRNHLLDLMTNRGIIDAATCALAKSERLPSRPYPLPQVAPHLTERAAGEGHKGKLLLTSVDRPLQEQLASILAMHSGRLSANQVFNAAAIVVRIQTGEVLAYLGNLPSTRHQDHGNQVDLITSPRSSGSILKPFLYAAMLNDGLLLPNTLVPDIPMQIGGFIPENYNLTYDGAVPAHQALSRSLNIPAVKMLQIYGYEQFYGLLKKTGLTTLKKPAGHYGLALILGGAEATLWDLTAIYASMARTLNRFNAGWGYDRSDFHPLVYLRTGDGGRHGPGQRELDGSGHSVPEDPSAFKGTSPGSGSEAPSGKDKTSWWDAGSIWLTFEAMIEVARPDKELQWQQFSSSSKVAWKTGTSFGNRDAWAIGITPEFAAGVWVGNASGEGRPGITGIGAAAPILFDIFKALPASSWFARPDQALEAVAVCRYSGHRVSAICDVADTMHVPAAGLKTAPCPYHQLIHLDPSGQWQVNSACESPEKMQHVAWFILPPVQEWYFRSRNPFYRTVPPFRKNCTSDSDRKNMGMIYPANNSKVYIPVELDGKPGRVVLKAAHRDPQALVYWHLDERFIGNTRQVHQMAVAPEQGIHILTLVDQNGETLKIRFEVSGKRGDVGRGTWTVDRGQ